MGFCCVSSFDRPVLKIRPASGRTMRLSSVFETTPIDMAQVGQPGR